MPIFVASCQRDSHPYQNPEKYTRTHCLNTDEHPNPQAFATHSYPGNVRNEPTHTHRHYNYQRHPGGPHAHADTRHSGTHCYPYPQPDPQPTAHPATITNPNPNPIATITISHSSAAITNPITAAATTTQPSTADQHTDRSRSHADADNCTHSPSALHPRRPEAIRSGGLESCQCMYLSGRRELGELLAGLWRSDQRNWQQPGRGGSDGDFLRRRWFKHGG